MMMVILGSMLDVDQHDLLLPHQIQSFPVPNTGCACVAYR
jgi:hypothetical protein